MQINTASFEKKAVEAALKQNWAEAIQTNLQILTINPNDLNAKIRLGRAYLHTKDYAKAKKLFKEVLEKDPINSIAQKNYKLATEKTKVKEPQNVDPKSFLKEPGRTKEITLGLENLRISETTFSSGDVLKIKINKNNTTIFSDKNLNLATVTGEIASQLHMAKRNGYVCSANLIKINKTEKRITIMLKCDTSIFKGDKQLEKPYLKGSLIDDAEIEIEDVLEEV